MNMPATLNTDRYAKCIDVSKRVRWEIEQDVIRGRTLDLGKKFLPDGLSKVHELAFLTPDQQRFLSQVQGRTYANIFGLVERFICAKVMEVSQDYALGDQVALEALVRFSDEELKHQALFRRMEALAGEQMPAGYRFAPQPDEVARAVLGKSSWAVLALTLCIELFTQVHYRESIHKDPALSELWKDVFLFHWKEESQHAILDELEFVRENAKLTPEERERAVDDLIELVLAVDGIVQMQSREDAAYFIRHCGQGMSPEQCRAVESTLLAAYRWQYILSGTQIKRFADVLFAMTTPAQTERIVNALGTLSEAA
ncbi:hypothetical protein [Motiliproteus sp. SC1-56]|uniref:hypothetical protein n=1 Tax=Motiliproteus sp. SC1-56 TaxID=2799565 RepID=UPI001F5D7E4E|nr:hypothetical protein [Motiliproteus sp. SC1-56]